MLPYIAILLISAIIAESAVITEKCKYKYDGEFYARETVLTTAGLPTNLVYNPNTKDLFFTLIDLDSLQNETAQTKMDEYMLKNGELIKIDNIHGQAAAVDEDKNIVYIASDDGLHILNQTKANFVSLKDNDIVQLFKPKGGDDLYAVIFPENEVYLIDVEKNVKTKVENVPCAYILAVDHDDNIYFECDSKFVKALLNDFEEPIEFAGIANDAARGVNIDRNGRAILAANDGLYHLLPNSLVPRKVMNLPYVPSGIAFDEDGDVYVATNGAIYKYSDDQCEGAKGKRPEA